MKNFQIYQVDMSLPTGARIMFHSYETIQKEGTQLSLDDYKQVYEGEFEENTDSRLPIQEQIYLMFNITHPKDFKGHSLSMSDIISVDGKYYFCDSFGFREISFPENTQHKTEKKDNLHGVVSKILKDGKISGEVDVYPDGEVTVLIEWGDWKHEHGYLRYLMQQNGFRETDENVTEEDGSDCYSAIHTFKKVA